MLKTFSFLKFLFSFVQVLECAHCIYIINVTYFNLPFFMLAKDEKCRSIICTYVLAIVTVLIFKKEKKKKLKSYATIALLSIFTLGKGR